MSTKSRAKQTERNRRYTRRAGKLSMTYLGEYYLEKRGGLRRAFTVGTFITTSNPDCNYRVGRDGSFRRVNKTGDQVLVRVRNKDKHKLAA